VIVRELSPLTSDNDVLVYVPPNTLTQSCPCVGPGGRLYLSHGRPSPPVSRDRATAAGRGRRTTAPACGPSLPAPRGHHAHGALSLFPLHPCVSALPERPRPPMSRAGRRCRPAPKAQRCESARAGVPLAPPLRAGVVRLALWRPPDRNTCQSSMWTVQIPAPLLQRLRDTLRHVA